MRLGDWNPVLGGRPPQMWEEAVTEQEMQDRLMELHGWLGEALIADEMSQAFELADEIRVLCKQAFDDERAAFIATHHGHDRGDQ